MNRRNFLQMLGLGAVAVAAPKFIFDCGANLYKLDPDYNEVLKAGWSFVSPTHADVELKNLQMCTFYPRFKEDIFQGFDFQNDTIKARIG